MPKFMKNNTTIYPISVFAHYEYEDHPLFILMLPDKIGDSLAAQMLHQLDEWYGNTDQDTTDWALEYQVWARNLLAGDGIVLNPRYLAITEVQDIIEDLLAEESYKNRRAYRAAMALDERKLLDVWSGLNRPDTLSAKDVGNCDGVNIIRVSVASCEAVVYCRFSEKISVKEAGGFDFIIKRMVQELHDQGNEDRDIDWENLVQEACDEFCSRLKDENNVQGMLIAAPYDYVVQL